MADDLKRSGGFVPGVRPGTETADFLDRIMSQITFPGSLFLASVAVLTSRGISTCLVCNKDGHCSTEELPFLLW
jgi:preprotein translocase subunit SecY